MPYDKTNVVWFFYAQMEEIWEEGQEHHRLSYEWNKEIQIHKEVRHGS